MRIYSLRLASTLRVCLFGLFAVSLLLAAGCKSQRRYGERKPIPQWYHNFTSHYNGYFNANELVEIAEEQIADARAIDYTELLPIYPAYSAENASSQSASLDKAMEKVSLVVNIHRPSIYEDDSYLLLGKAQLLKQDYEAAEHTFAFAVKDFDPDNEANRLKRLEKSKIAAGKERAKKERSSASRNPQTRSRPSPSKKKKRRKTAPPSRSKKGKSSSSKSSPSSSAGKSKKPSDNKKKSKKPQKRKTRAEMAREQREAKMQAEKDALKAVADQEKQEREDAEAALEAEADRLAALEAGKVPDASDALNDGEGLANPTTTEEKPKHGIFVHETALQDLNYWLARTYVAREKYIDAERILGKLARSGGTFKHVRRELPATYAELHLKRQEYAEALPYLKDAIALTKDRGDRARYSYIKGQVNQRLGDAPAAYADFKRVIKLKPDFEMVFNAELNLATTAYATGNSDLNATIKTLNRMSKEDKYDEYQDQVFFKMAEISLEAGDRPEGIGYLQKGLAANKGNQALAAKAYLKLGDLYFQDESYVLASNYYDSTLQVLPKKDPRYAEISRYRDNLKPVAENLTAIALQDSLIAISKMPRDEQRKLAAQLEQDRRDNARSRAIAASKKAAEAPTTGKPKRGGPTQTSFFAYDDRAKRRGARAFSRRFGDRPLGDNWRTLDSRESRVTIEQISTEVASATVSDEELDDILKAVPNDESMLASSNKVIENALISLGRQYRDKLENPQRAAEALEELLRRYPGTEFGAEAMYLAALAYDELRQSVDAQRMRDRLVKEDPDSDYAKSITNPAFFDEARGAERKLVEYYDATFAAFERGEMQDVIQRITDMPAEFVDDNPLEPRFALLRSMAVGKVEGKEAYVEGLRNVVSKYPSADEATRAKEILRLLGERSGASGGLDQAAKTGNDRPKAESNFQLEPDKSHYFLAVLPKDVSMSTAKANVADYNSEYHRLDKLAIGNVYMMSAGEQTPVVVIRRFSTQGDAMSYYAGAIGKPQEFIKDVEFTAVVISMTNYREVLRSKSFAEYIEFFSQNYL